MSGTDDFFEWLIENNHIRPSVRAIIFNAERSRILVEKNSPPQTHYTNFIGGGIELGESFVECIHREIQEETQAKIIRHQYLFVLENIITYKGIATHGIEHYFAVELDRESLISQEGGVSYLWFEVDQLHGVDLRPNIVRDVISNHSYENIRHLISREEYSPGQSDGRPAPPSPQL